MSITVSACRVVRCLMPLRRFFCAREGSVLTMTALSLVVLITAAGLASDFARGYIVKTRLNSALDAAGLAAAAVIHSKDVGTEVDRFFRANFPDGFMGAEVDGPHYVLSDDESVITLDATAQVDTVFMNVIGKTAMDVGASSEITRESKGLELVLAMDNTGSMNNNGKLDTMKNAATDLVNILYGDEEIKDNLWVGLVPYSQAVNIGNNHQAWLDPIAFAALNYGPDPWAGCVDARDYPADTQDDIPSDDLFKPYHWADNNNYNDWIRYNGTYRSGLGSNLGPNKYCPQAVTPMTAEKTTILDGIAAMEARGNTHSNLGMVWAWRMISPKWRGIWGVPMPDELPLDYHTPLMNKVVILLTDGMNTHSNSSDSAYGYLWQGVLGTTNSGVAQDILDQRLTESCDAMKAEGIIVYTITFQLSDTGTQAIFRSCASDPEYYFNSPTNEELTQAFHTIADSLGNLRISK